MPKLPQPDGVRKRRAQHQHHRGDRRARVRARLGRAPLSRRRCGSCRCRHYTAAAAAADTTAGDAGAGGAGAAAGHDPWRYTPHPTMGGGPTGAPSMGRAKTLAQFRRPRRHPRVSVADAEALGPMGVAQGFARSIPARIDGSRNWSDTLSRWSLGLPRGGPPAAVAASPDPCSSAASATRATAAASRAAPPARGWRVPRPGRGAARAAAGGGAPVEHVSVQQSPSGDLSEFGLPSLPPLIGEIAAHTMQARNFWAAAPPKVSVLHYDWQDSILLQLSGTKKFTIVDPARLPASYPCVQLMTQLVRRAPGVFDARETERELDNFPLVRRTRPRPPPLARRAQNNGSSRWSSRAPRSSSPRTGTTRSSVRRARPAQRRGQLLVPGLLARDAPLPHAARDALSTAPRRSRRLARGTPAGELPGNYVAVMIDVRHSYWTCEASSSSFFAARRACGYSSATAAARQREPQVRSQKPSTTPLTGKKAERKKRWSRP